MEEEKKKNTPYNSIDACWDINCACNSVVHPSQTLTEEEKRLIAIVRTLPRGQRFRIVITEEKK